MNAEGNPLRSVSTAALQDAIAGAVTEVTGAGFQCSIKRIDYHAILGGEITIEIYPPLRGLVSTPMTYFAYENWQADGHRATIHFGDCGHCNNGHGVHPEAGTQHGRWHGPFASFREAHSTAEAEADEVRTCKHCNPN